MSEHLKMNGTFVFSRTITCEEVVGICQLMGLDPCSPDSSTLRPLMQTFATGPVCAALANLAGFNGIPVSSALEYSAPVEIGDTITAIAEPEETTRNGSLKVRLCFQNHRGELVAEGWALMGQNLDHSSPVSANAEGPVGGLGKGPSVKNDFSPMEDEHEDTRAKDH